MNKFKQQSLFFYFILCMAYKLELKVQAIFFTLVVRSVKD